MHPEPVFYLLDQPINLYVIFGMASGLLPVFLALWLAPRRGLSPVVAADAWVMGWVVGIGSAFLLPGLIGLMVPGFAASSSLLGIACGVSAVILFLRRQPMSRAQPAAALDLFAPLIALFQGIGRFGCLAAGCCHGKPAWGLPWAVTMAAGSSSIYQNIPVHPTQLYEAAGGCALCALLIALFDRPAWRGTLIWVYLLGYGLLRFVVEGYRASLLPPLGPLSLTQWVCLGMIILGAAMLARRFVQPRLRPILGEWNAL